MAVEINKWEVRGKNEDGETVVVNWGTQEKGFPDAGMRKLLRAHGYKIYVNGHPYEEPKTVKK